MNRLLGITCLCIIGALTVGSPLQAQTTVWWNGTAGNGQYEDPANWDGGVFPTDNNAYINSGVINMAADAPTPNQLYIGAEQGDVLATPGRALVYHTAGVTNVADDIFIASNVAGSTNSNNAVLYMSGGEFGSTATNDQLRIGRCDNGLGYVELTGGLLHSCDIMVGDSNADVGVLYQTGGTTSVSTSIRVSSSGNGIGTYNLTGGVARGEVGTTEYIYCGGTGSTGNWGHLNVSGAGRIENFDYIRISGHSTSKGYLTLGTGGVIEVGLIAAASATVAGGGEAFFSFHGGTLRARRSTTNWVKPTVETGGIFVGVEGGIIDTQEFDTGIIFPIQHLAGLGVGSISTTTGAEYLAPPVVQITQADDDLDGQRGRGASAVANVDTNVNSPTYGQVQSITVTNPGSGYDADDAVTVTILRGGYSTQAIATAVLAENAAVDGGLTKIGTGTLTLSAANTYTGDTNVNEGALRVTGSLAGTVKVADGAVWSGNHTPGGNSTVGGNLDLSAGGDMLWNLAALMDNTTGTAGTDFDQTVVAGSVTLGAASALTLNFDALAEADRPGYTTPNAFWSADHSWTILDAGAGVTGNFGFWLNATFASGSFTTSVDALNGDVQLNYSAGTLPPIPGDTNNDRKVDADDARKLAQNWGAQMAGGAGVGDFNDDGRINAADASILAANWGDHTGGEGAAVPEPSTVVVLLAGLASMTLFRRRD